MPDFSSVPPAVRELSRSLGELRPMRRGSLSVRFMRCNKPRCPCGDSMDARHGPYCSVVRVVAGKTQSQSVPADRVEVARRQVTAGQEFRKRVEAAWNACERWADAELEDAEAALKEAAKKGGSKRSSRPRSPRRLTPS